MSPFSVCYFLIKPAQLDKPKMHSYIGGQPFLYHGKLLLLM